MEKAMETVIQMTGRRDVKVTERTDSEVVVEVDAVIATVVAVVEEEMVMIERVVAMIVDHETMIAMRRRTGMCYIFLFHIIY